MSPGSFVDSNQTYPQDSTPISNPTFPHAQQENAAALCERVATVLDAVDTLYTTLLAIASQDREDESSATSLRISGADETWARLVSELQQLENTTTRLQSLGDTLAQSVLIPPANGVGNAPKTRTTSTGNLHNLIAAQRATLTALNQQLGKAEAILSRAPSVEKPTVPNDLPKSYGNVEIQDVSEFIGQSPIASIPINASYYQRILEAARSPEGHKRPMGSILMAAGLITARQLENALQHQKEGHKRPLGTLLVDLGYTTDSAIAQTIAAQLALPFVTLASETIHQDAVDAIPLHVARRHGCFPVSVTDGALYIAMANPLDLIALDDLRLASGKHVRPCVASREEITDHINRHYTGSSF